MAAPLFAQSSAASTTVVVTNPVDEFSSKEDGDERVNEIVVAVSSGPAAATTTATSSIAYLPQTVVLSDFRHDGFEESVPLGPAESGLVSKWRPKDRVSSSFKLLFLRLLLVLLNLDL